MNLYIFGRTYFNSLVTVNTFNILFWVFGISEMLIWIFTSRNSEKGQGRKGKDRGSYIFLMTGTVFTIFIDAVISRVSIGHLPMAIFWVGALLMAIGIFMRVYSVWTLRHFFTLSIQVKSDHKIVQNGPYRYLRHPAYTGSILTFLGIAVCFRNPVALLLSGIVLALIYSYRIKVEEEMLEESFGEGYLKYEKSTWRVLPFVW